MFQGEKKNTLFWATCPVNTADLHFLCKSHICFCIAGVLQYIIMWCAHTVQNRSKLTALQEQKHRGQAWYILLRAHDDLRWEQVGLLNLDLLAPSGSLAAWPWVSGWRLAIWRTGSVVVSQSADLLTKCMSAGRSGRLVILASISLTDWEADW